MSDRSVPDDNPVAESPDMTAEPDADDPADLTGAAAESIVDHQEDEVDQLAADADRAGVGHGPDQS